MFGRKSRGQVIGEELSEGLSHVRIAANEATKAAAEALAPRVEAARGAVAPRVEAAREALAPRVEATRGAIVKGFDTAREQAEDRLSAAREQAAAARDQAEHRLSAARDQADAKRVEIAEASRRSAKKTAKRAKKNAKNAKKTAIGARKDAKAAIADAKAQAKSAVEATRSDDDKRRRWPWVLAIAGVIGVVVAKSRAKTDDDLWGAPSDSPVNGYTEDPQPSSVDTMADDHKPGTPATDDPYPGTVADDDGTIADKTDDYKSVASENDGPLHGKLADSAHETGTSVGDSPEAQEETWSEMIDATKDNDDEGNADEAAKHAASEAKSATKKPKG
ncbi:MAG: hypothetical protein H0X18_04325 [Geodermatophilaceae bacterium]|nr:hypothetical protein [Geodermatophilaceae bacterium]